MLRSSLYHMLLPLCVFTAGPVWSQAAPDTVDVFFVGNSFTYFNNLPALVEGISHSVGTTILRTGSHTHGGFSLNSHLEDGHLQDLFSQNYSPENAWDRVIIQEHSSFGVAWKDSVSGKLADPSSFYESVRSLNLLMRQAGVEPMLYMTWATLGFPGQIEDLSTAYDSIGEELSISVAPVGLAFARVTEERPALGLYTVFDGKHPNSVGSYLAACVIYAQLSEHSPEGARTEIAGDPWNFDELVTSNGRTVLVSLDLEVAKYLQAVAWEVVSSRFGRRD